MEDNPADVFLIRAALRAANLLVEVQVVKDGEQAMRFFDQVDGDAAARCPNLVILDINLPKKPGGEVLQHIRQSRRCGKVLVIAVSTSGAPRDREVMTQLGANAYFSKPSEYEAFMKLGQIVKDALGC